MKRPAIVQSNNSFMVRDQTCWRKLFDIPTSLYGGVSGYLNLARRGDAPASPSENK